MWVGWCGGRVVVAPLSLNGAGAGDCAPETTDPNSAGEPADPNAPKANGRGGDAPKLNGGGAVLGENANTGFELGDAVMPAVRVAPAALCGDVPAAAPNAALGLPNAGRGGVAPNDGVPLPIVKENAGGVANKRGAKPAVV